MLPRRPLQLFARTLAAPARVHLARTLPWGQLTRDTAALFTRVAPAAIGHGPSLAELEFWLAHSKTETGFGQLWDGQMAGSNNFGAVQCTKGMLATGGNAICTCPPHLDHHGDGTPYTTGFRFYRAALGRTAAENGAADYLQQLYGPIRRNTGAALQRGAPLRETSRIMAREHYFEADANKYAEGLFMRAKEVSRDLGQPLVLALDGPASGSPSSPVPLLLFAAAAGLVAWQLGAFD